MLQAEYLSNPEKDIWALVTAENYDALVHGTNLRCGDPLCQAPVRFRNCDTSHAGSFNRRSHFASYDIHNHRSGCTHLTEYEVHHNSVSVSEAVEYGYPVLLNMNFMLGHPLYKAFGSSANAEEIKSRYNSFRQRKTHASVSIKTVDDYFALIRRLCSKDAEIIDRIYVAHCQDLREQDNFSIGNDPEKRRKLLNNLENEARLDPKGIAIGFPRHIKFKPTQRELKDLSTPRESMNGDSLTLARRGEGKLILLNTLEFSDANMRPVVLDFDFNDVFATPIANLSDIEAARRKFARGEQAFISIRWQVISAGQFQPSSDAKPIPKPFMQQDLFAQDRPSAAAE